MNRTKRKSCVIKRGLEEFKFNYAKELSIYYYAKGEKISRSRMKMIRKEEKFNSHTEWKNYVGDKYRGLSKEDLLELRQYILHRERRHRPIIDFTSPYLSAMISAALSYMITGKVFEINPEADNVIKVIGFLIVFFCVFGGFAWLVVACMNVFVSNGIEEGFYTDYLEVISEIIEEKEKAQEKEADTKMIIEIMKKIVEKINKLEETEEGINKKIDIINQRCKKMDEVLMGYGNVKSRKEGNFLGNLLECISRYL